VSGLTFSDLPKVGNQGELRTVHQTAGQFLVKRGGKAHSSMNCDHLSDSELVDNPKWRVASGAHCRELGIPWCEDC
jgi:hypothetical protein